MEKYIYRAKLERVVDGDTVDAMIDLGFDTWVKRRIRFMGVDTWECRTRNKEEKIKGLAAKARTTELLTEVTDKPNYFRLKSIHDEQEMERSKQRRTFLINNLTRNPLQRTILKRKPHRSARTLGKSITR